MGFGWRGYVCGWALRALSLFMFAELSGLSHAAMDLSCALAGIEHHIEEDCEQGDQGHECPPGCPNCHCWHTGLVSPQLSAALEPSRALPRPPDVPPPAYNRAQPEAPDQSALYRPPRTLGHLKLI